MFCMYIFKFNLVYRVIFYGWKYVYLDFCFYLIVYILYNIYMNNIYNYQFGIGIFFLFGLVYLLVGVCQMQRFLLNNEIMVFNQIFV